MTPSRNRGRHFLRMGASAPPLHKIREIRDDEDIVPYEDSTKAPLFWIFLKKGVDICRGGSYTNEVVK